MNSKRILILISLTFWVNYDFISLRIVDIFIIFLILFFIRRSISVKLSKVLPYIFLYMVSVFVGYIYNSDINIFRYIFIYKYLSLLVLYFGFSAQSKHEILLIKNLLSWVFLFLVLYVYYYNFIFSPEHYKSARVSFPLSRDIANSDAHLYSYVLVILYTVKNLSRFSLSTILDQLILTPALLLTGSRTGIGLFVLVTSLLLVRQNRYFIVLLILSSVAYFIADFKFLLLESEQVNRAIDFNLTVSDASTSGRLRKFMIGYDEISQTFPFGVGNLSSALRWYDNGFMQIMISFGFIGFLVFVKDLFLQILNGDYKYRVVLYLILISFFSSEYFLVTRAAVPTVFLIVYAKNINSYAQF